MRTLQMILGLALLLTLAVPAHAQFGDVTVYVEFVADPLIGGGGYNEVTVANTGSDAVYAVIIGNDLSEVIYTSPALAGQWSPRRDGQSTWESGGIFSDYGFYTPPATETLDWNLYVGAGYSQVLCWQVTGTGTSIGAGETMVGLRYLPGIGARALGDPVGPVPFVAFGPTGEAVAHGTTVLNNPVPVQVSNFGRIKSLFAR